jgi:hypothetical protein
MSQSYVPEVHVDINNFVDFLLCPEKKTLGPYSAEFVYYEF